MRLVTRAEVLDKLAHRFDVDAVVASAVRQEQRFRGDGRFARQRVDGADELANSRTQCLTFRVLVSAGRRLGHVVPEIDGTDEAGDDGDSRLLAGEDHTGAAAHRYPRNADARQVN